MINRALREVYVQKLVRYYGFTIDCYMALNNIEQDLLLYNYLNMKKSDNSIQGKQEIKRFDKEFDEVIKREQLMKDKVKMLVRKRG